MSEGGEEVRSYWIRHEIVTHLRASVFLTSYQYYCRIV